MLKKLPRILIIFFIAIFALQLAALVFLILQPRDVWAVEYTPQVAIPGGPSGTINENSIAQYIVAIYKYGTGMVGILAAVVMMVGGLMWLTAGGNTSQVQSAKEWIKAALTGLIIALLSYIILLTINPDLVKFNSITITPVTSVPGSSTTNTSTSSGEQGLPTPSFNPNIAVNLPVDDLNPTPTPAPTPVIPPLDTSQFNNFGDMVTMPPNEEVMILEPANTGNGIGLDTVSDFEDGVHEYTINVPADSDYQTELLERMQEFYDTHSSQNISVNVTNVRVSTDGTQCTFNAEITQNE